MKAADFASNDTAVLGVVTVLGGTDDRPYDESGYIAVWDSNTEASLKSQTRAKRGETAGNRTQVSAKIPLPKGAQWQKFLKAGWPE